MGFNFKDLFVLDIANNHQGYIDHGLRIIDEHSKVVKKKGVRAGFKFQFRNLKTFIHKDFGKSEIKHIKRFNETKISDNDYQKLLQEIKEKGIYSICTPFDEESVDKIVDFGFDILKIASCSSNDWPLLEKISETNLPTIISTGGLEIDEIDNIVSFAEHRKIDLAIMHCVSIYPTSDEQCELNNIKMLKERYPGLTVGWSTHENPDDSNIVSIAKAAGAEMFERHIGVETDNFKLNKYSSTPKQINNWIDSWDNTNKILGKYNRNVQKIERDSLHELRRGVYLRRSLKKNHLLKRNDVYFAMPCQDKQLYSGDFKEDVILNEDLKKDDALFALHITFPEISDANILYKYVHKVKAMLNHARIDLGNEFNVEYSHHYGVKRFSKTGCVLIECINREYCKKILIQIPGQSHPFHFHKRKEETFQVLWGVMNINIDGREKKLFPGDTALVLPGTWHKFNTEQGFIAEEISTTHFDNDSIYKDKDINDMEKKNRKTTVKHWGRFEIQDKLPSF